MIASKSTGWIGVDVGTRSVKLAQVVRRNGGVSLVDAAIVPRTEAWRVEDLSQINPITTKSELLAARSVAANCSGRRAACCTSMALCSTATTDVDPATNQPNQEALTQLLALPPNTQAVIDFCLAGNPPHETKDAIVFALSERWSNQIAQDAMQAGLRCDVIDALPIALARATSLDPTLPASTMVAAIDWGFSTTTLCVANRGEPCFVRMLPRCSMQRLVEDVSEGLGIDHSESEQVLVRQGMKVADSPEDSLALSQVLHSVLRSSLREITEEVKRTVRFLQTHQQSRVPEVVKLFGGGASVPGMAETLADGLGLPVSNWKLGNGEGQTHEALTLLGPAISLSMLAWRDNR